MVHEKACPDTGKEPTTASDTSLSTTAMTQEWQSKAGNQGTRKKLELAKSSTHI